MATQRVQIPVSFQYLNGSGDLIPIPAGTSLSIIDRNSGNPAVVFASFAGGSTIAAPATDTGGNVPGYVVEGSYAITAAPNLSASPAFAGATINYEAVRGDGVENIFPGAVNNAAIAGGAITIDKLAAALQQSLMPAGTITDFAGTTAPAGWHLCDGSVQARAGTFAALFAVIGTVYNTGGESGSNFRLPNVQGRFTLGAGSGVISHTLLNDRGGSLNHVHNLGTPGVTINLGTPSLTVNVPGLFVAGHSHPLSSAGGAQVRARSFFLDVQYLLSGEGGPFFNTTGYSAVTGFQSNDSNVSAKGVQQSYGLIGNTEPCAGFSTSGASAHGNLDIGQQASGNVNGGQNSQSSDPAYITLNKIIKL